MIHLYGDYYTESDGKYNIILYRKRTISGAKQKAKEENVGKDTYDVEGHYGTVSALVDGLSRKLMIDILADKKVKDLADAVERLNKIIDSLSFTVKVNGVDQVITAKMMPKG